MFIPVQTTRGERDSMGRLDEKVVVITGAGRGIGRAAAGLFTSEGARVAILEIDEERGVAAEREIRDAGGDACFIQTDVTDADSVTRAIPAVVERFGKIDVLYNNAGGSTTEDAGVVDAPVEEFWRVIKLDLWGTFLICKHGIPALIDNGGGCVVNTASNLAVMGIRGRDCYSAAKGGVAAMTRSMAVEYAPRNIRVNAVAPAATRTERVIELARANEHIDALIREGQLLGWCEPIDIAYMALYLASDESASTTGQVMLVDGGATIF
jgi:NAD(P)-dependent dehydrogenase (short-subunit alcohol dehydrogenase family)